MGLGAGFVALVVLAAAPAMGVYRGRSVLVPMVLLAGMAGLTVYSQFAVIPAMERDRIAAGGVIDALDAANPIRLDFEKLHKRSESVEGAILLLGLATVVLVARAETKRA